MATAHPGRSRRASAGRRCRQSDRGGEPEHLPEREVPRHHREHGAQRFVHGFHVRPCWTRVAVFAEVGARVLGVVVAAPRAFRPPRRPVRWVSPSRGSSSRRTPACSRGGRRPRSLQLLALAHRPLRHSSNATIARSSASSTSLSVWSSYVSTCSPVAGLITCIRVLTRRTCFNPQSGGRRHRHVTLRTERPILCHPTLENRHLPINYCPGRPRRSVRVVSPRGTT